MDPIAQTPCVVPVRLVCPECGQVSQVDIEIVTELVQSEGFDGEWMSQLRSKAKSEKVGHVHRQTTLDGAVSSK